MVCTPSDYWRTDVDNEYFEALVLMFGAAVLLMLFLVA